jgi:hypothetical protein
MCGRTPSLMRIAAASATITADQSRESRNLDKLIYGSPAFSSVANITAEQYNIASYCVKLSRTSGQIELNADPGVRKFCRIACIEVFAADGKHSKTLYAIGALTKGRLWESTAVPETRAQASALARDLLELLPQAAGSSDSDEGSNTPRRRFYKRKARTIRGRSVRWPTRTPV